MLDLPRSRGVRLRSSLSLSVVVHLFFAIICAFLIQQQAAQIMTKRTTTWIDVDSYSPKKPRTSEDDNKKQIVQTTPGQRVAVAPKDSFLGEHNQEVDRQTVKKGATVIAKPSPRHNQKAKELTESKNRKEASALSKAMPLQNLGVPILPQVNEEASDQKDESRWATGDSSPNEWVKGMKESDRTALNTKEFVFYGYYQRIRERLDRAWVPLLREKVRRIYTSGRRLASDMDFATKVLVVMNNQGQIVRVRVLNESGTADLDDAAVDAFKTAGPFPNPPRGIIGPNGEIEIPWEFILKNS